MTRAWHAGKENSPQAANIAERAVPALSPAKEAKRAKVDIDAGAANNAERAAPALSPAKEAKRAKVDIDDAAVGGETPAVRERAAASEGAAPRASLQGLLETAAPDTAGIMAEFLWGTVVEERVDDESGLVRRSRFTLPELGRLVQCGKSVGMHVLRGCKDRRGTQEAAGRSFAEVRSASDRMSFLRGFRSLWRESRKLRLMPTDEADLEEIKAYIGMMIR